MIRSSTTSSLLLVIAMLQTAHGAMPPCATFDYVATVPNEAERHRPWTVARSAHDVRAPTGRDSWDNRLVGWNPSLVVDGGLFTLHADGDSHAEVLAASFTLDSDLVAKLQSGDRVTMVRDQAGRLAVSANKDDGLLFAVGHIPSLALEGFDFRTSSSGFVTDGRADDLWIEVRTAHGSSRLRAGDEVVLGNHDLRVVCIWQEPLWTHMSAALFSKAFGSRDATIRSAILLEEDVKMEPDVRVERGELPIYPAQALQDGIAGHCMVQFNVTASGKVEDVQIVHAEPMGIFEETSIAAALKFEYQPRIVDGEPFPTGGIRHFFRYDSQDSILQSPDASTTGGEGAAGGVSGD